MTRLAYLFPGQGSQHPGMGAALAEAYPESRAVFEAADRALEKPLSEMCFTGSAGELTLTENTQPAVLAASVAALRALDRHGLRPQAAAGHSLGEYTAHVAAGTLDLADALRTVRQRGRFMQEAVPVGDGAMAAVLGLPREDVIELCREHRGDQVLCAANLNGPKQTVIAGHAAAVARAVKAAPAAGARRAIPLQVSAPFHSPLMEPAARRLQDVLAAVDFADPAYPVFTNADAAPVTVAAEARDALVRQVASPVRWHELIESMIGAGYDIFVEVGPGQVLAGLVRGIDRGVRVMSVGDPQGVERLLAELGKAAEA